MRDKPKSHFSQFQGGTDDRVLRATKYIREIETLMSKAGKAQNFTYDLFPGAGHLFDIPFSPVANKDFHSLVPKPAKLYYGGDDFELHSAAQEIAWAKTLEFYRRNLT